MKIKLIIVALLLFVMLVGCSEQNEKVTRQIGITQIASHPALDEVRKGIIDGLSEHGYTKESGAKIIERNANGDPSLALSLAQDFVRRNVDIIIPITTPSTLAAARATPTHPIVFSGVSYPERVGLIDDMKSPGGNVTGMSDRWPFKRQIEAYLKLFPEKRRVWNVI